MRRSRKESGSFCAALLSILGVVVLCASLSAATVSRLAAAVEETPESQISSADLAVSKLQVGIAGVYKSGVPTRVDVSWQGDAANLSF
ncbi:MAG: hypothetical protein ACI4QC_09360, partial [Thermoguttaceae bacterium]